MLPNKETNPVLLDVMKYYIERRNTNNPKTWRHVQRKLNQALEQDLYSSATSEQVLWAQHVVEMLCQHEECNWCIYCHTYHDEEDDCAA